MAPMRTLQEILAKEKQLLSVLFNFSLHERDPLGDGDQSVRLSTG